MAASDKKGISFLQWALPKLGYRWDGFKKPRSQVLKRITDRMQELNLSGGFTAYRDYLRDHPEEWKVLDRLLDVTISKFFRDRKLWVYLRDQILAQQLGESQKPPLLLWSVGCCNGEEPYSLAILIEHLEERMEIRRETEILASDRNQEVLQRARIGRYPEGALKELTDKEIKKFFQPIDDSENDYQIARSCMERVQFEQRDIRESMPKRVFDIICCRNLVFTYYTLQKQRQFLERVHPHLDDGGYLLIGANESLPEVRWLKRVTSTHPVYRKQPGR